MGFQEISILREEELQIRPGYCLIRDLHTELPVKFLDCLWMEGLVDGRGIFSLASIFSHFGHAFRIEGPFKEDRFRGVDEFGQGFLKSVGRKMSGAHQE
jgi:hypothetical protein